MITLLKHHLTRAQNRMSQLANRKRPDRVFEIGNWVYLKLQPYSQVTLKQHGSQKLSPRYYGPYLVIDKIGKVSYKLQLPPESKIHNVFHVSQLKLCPNPTAFSSSALPQYMPDFGLEHGPETILERQFVKRGNATATRVLVKWKNKPPEAATWEFFDNLMSKFPDFHP